MSWWRRQFRAFQTPQRSVADHNANPATAAKNNKQASFGSGTTVKVTSSAHRKCPHVCRRRRTDWEKHAMAFPSDLSDVVVFKVPPAIGVARLSANDDYFIFGSDPGSYKSNNLMKRQAVQFRVFAYGDNHVGLGELTPDLMDSLNITAVWSAKVANRKIAYQLQQ